MKYKDRTEVIDQADTNSNYLNNSKFLGIKNIKNKNKNSNENKKFNESSPTAELEDHEFFCQLKHNSPDHELKNRRIMNLTDRFKYNKTRNMYLNKVLNFIKSYL